MGAAAPPDRRGRFAEETANAGRFPAQSARRCAQDRIPGKTGKRGRHGRGSCRWRADHWLLLSLPLANDSSSSFSKLVSQLLFRQDLHFSVYSCEAVDMNPWPDAGAARGLHNWNEDELGESRVG